MAMRAFEVYLNNQKLCLAGVGDRGVLSAHVTWNTGDANESLELETGGLISTNMEFVSWIRQRPLSVGDHVRISVVEANSVDEPKPDTAPIQQRSLGPRRPTFAEPRRNLDGKSLYSPQDGRKHTAKRSDFTRHPRLGTRDYATAPAAIAAASATTFPGPCATDVASACSARLITSVTMSIGS